LLTPGPQLIFRKTAAYIFLLGLFFLSLTPGYACRYTVRELGFSDLAAPPYRLFICHHAELSALQNEKLARLLEASISGSNLEVFFVHSGREPQHPILRFLPASPSSYPCAVLISPDSSLQPYRFASSTDDMYGFTSRTIQNTLRSPVRETILSSSSSLHAVVLLFAGADEKQTAAASSLIRSAMQQVEPVLKLMPKPAVKPPLLVSIPVAEQNRESLLMWSLGMSESTRNPRAVILYGRGRKMGPVLANDSLTTEAIYNLLLFVGADCECDMDRSYLNGYLIPLYWPQTARERVSNILGFDPENPLVKMDMINIARIYSSRDRLNGSASTAVRSGRAEAGKKNNPSRPNGQSPEITKKSQDAIIAGRTILCGILALGLAVLFGALIILFIMKRRSSQ
jgi:hypothetical protein